MKRIDCTLVIEDKTFTDPQTGDSRPYKSYTIELPNEVRLVFKPAEADKNLLKYLFAGGLL